MDVLKRFNTVLDLRGDVVHLSPSALIGTNYSGFGGVRGLWIAVAIGGLLLLAGAFSWMRRRAMSRSISS